MKASVFKELAKRHHLAVARNVPAEESTIGFESVLSHKGAEDSWLAHGTVGHIDMSISLRQLQLKSTPKQKPKLFELFVVTAPQQNSSHMLITTPSLPEEFQQLLLTKGSEVKPLRDELHHKVTMKHVPQPDEQASARLLAAKLPKEVNLEKTTSQLILFTATMPDESQAEHLVRLAVKLC